MPYAVATERLTLRAFQLDDGASLFDAIEEGREVLERWLDWPIRCRTPRDAGAYCRRARGMFDLAQHFRYAIVSHGEERLLGGISMHTPDAASGRCVIELWVRASSARTGVAAEALRTVAGLAFQAGASRVELVIEPNNRPSRALAAHVGFRQEGLLRAMLVRGGRTRDVVLYGLVPDDWGRLSRTGTSGVRLRTRIDELERASVGR